MMLGKRPRKRPPIKRTTSMNEFSYDDLTALAIQRLQSSDEVDSDDQTPSLSVSCQRALNRRNSADFVLESNGTFLRTCSLCHRRLAPTRDIYMYKGDSAFCSLDCRQRQMTKDEWKEKTIKKESDSSTSASHSSSNSTKKGEKILAL